ncbi:hypothetical protein [Phormidium sp. CCY1219]|uniref:hypothetical protein n=1 Tax=Phormidium sp. CCY1219 TaxID=2886104 RepID=UPI002D1E7C09|nr:hypothetical protein [Phormidium sp. CCY1219]MEB3830973.1 hypothetical protein [Phormidium sp. CCY1219]
MQLRFDRVTRPEADPTGECDRHTLAQRTPRGDGEKILVLGTAAIAGGIMGKISRVMGQCGNLTYPGKRVKWKKIAGITPFSGTGYYRCLGSADKCC